MYIDSWLFCKCSWRWESVLWAVARSAFFSPRSLISQRNVRIYTGSLGDLRAVAPALDFFPAAAAGWGFLQHIYDWDTVVLDGNATVRTLESELNLGTLNLPCVLQLKGVMKFSGSGQFFCSSDFGCSRISFQSVSSLCWNNSKTVLKMQGSMLIMSNSSFAGCGSDTDGGVVQAYDLAEVVIDSCNFTDTFSSGFGGAVAAYGSNLSISRSFFQSCIASRGGGAVWSAVFQDCYGSNKIQNTNLLIIYSVFKSCCTGGAGGAVLADAPASLRSGGELSISIKSTRFSLCTSSAEGGGLHISGSTVYAHLRYTLFDSCTSGASGGAISSSSLSALSLVACTVHNNTALGAGGGGVHLNQSYFSAYEASVYSNSAPSGGGGAIYWQGWVNSSAIACPEGTSSVDALLTPAPAPSPAPRPICWVGTCAPCGAGTYSNSEGLSVCISCPPGTYSAVDGSSVCSGCPAGQYASLEGANSPTACVNCEAGTYTHTAGLSSCSLCPAGTYSAVESANSSSVCISCPEGQHASPEGANSSAACGTNAIVPFQTQPQLKSVELGKESTDFHSSTREAHPDRTVRQRRRRAQAELMNESVILSSLCGANNSALYGHYKQCIATDFWTLQVSEASDMVYSGVPFNFTAVKQDAYGTTILSDSSSLLQAIPTTADKEIDSLTSVLGSAVSVVKRGKAVFQFAIKATFTKIDYARKLAGTNSPIFLLIEGADLKAASGSKMRSDLVSVHMQQGGGVCPQGYILALEQEGEVNGSAICTLCKSGTYSVSPLASGSESPTASPACLSCPAGGNCSLGGADIHFSNKEIWRVIDGMYILVSCPSGYQKINSTAGTSKGKFSSTSQQCKVCLPEQYIVNPDTDSCQQCPQGAPNFVDVPISL
jgi:hypothetical protein